MSELTASGDDYFSLGGEVTMKTVPALVESGWKLLSAVPAGQQTVIDLSGVTQADSAALAMLLTWLRRASEQQVSLQFDNLPADLESLGKVCGTDELIPRRPTGA